MPHAKILRPARRICCSVDDLTLFARRPRRVMGGKLEAEINYYHRLACLQLRVALRDAHRAFGFRYNFVLKAACASDLDAGSFLGTAAAFGSSIDAGTQLPSRPALCPPTHSLRWRAFFARLHTFAGSAFADPITLKSDFNNAFLPRPLSPPARQRALPLEIMRVRTLQ